ncbi:type IV pilin protein [Stenotrophomonas sp. ISL-67]|uniref:type IV pilin protein n=1 Tax=Stenotrophomonas sp. ISL-67 TaxID=2819171 RepID=UPI001BE7F449|nr:type IV pilin protein [Stenotrophomonas sp. ISL-67]MBT2766553.1 type IV pilin protein [Stenotrophomonas sp. ISL-67]
MGFTLIELMITVAVVAIISAIAYPSYTNQVRKSKRAAAKAELVEYAQRAERQHTLNNSYAGFSFVENNSTTIASPRDGSREMYQVTIVPAANTFTITAVPQGDQAKDPCGTLSVNQAGVKTPANTGALECW